MRSIVIGYIVSSLTGHQGSQMALEDKTKDKVSVFKPVFFKDNMLNIVCDNTDIENTDIDINGTNYHLSYTGSTYLEIEFKDGKPESITVEGVDHDIIWKE